MVTILLKKMLTPDKNPLFSLQVVSIFKRKKMHLKINHI